MAHSFISIKKFVDEPYSKILGYPKATSRQIRSRINELEKLKIKSIALTGPTTLGNLAILGKGYVGIVGPINEIDFIFNFCNSLILDLI